MLPSVVKRGERGSSALSRAQREFVVSSLLRLQGVCHPLACVTSERRADDATGRTNVTLALPMLVVWCTIAGAWLFVMPPGTRGKTWHYVHGAIPLVAIVVFLSLPEGPLRDILRVWLLAGILILAGLAVTWAIGTILRNH